MAAKKEKKVRFFKNHHWALYHNRLNPVGKETQKKQFESYCHLNKPKANLGRSMPLQNFLMLSTPSGIPLSFTSLFPLVCLLALFGGLNPTCICASVVFSRKYRFFRVRQTVPLGIILGPVLFPCFINNFPAFLPSSVRCSLYADHLAMSSFSPSVSAAAGSVQGALV